jgi:hypothetical protein
LNEDLFYRLGRLPGGDHGGAELVGSDEAVHDKPVLGLFFRDAARGEHRHSRFDQNLPDLTVPGQPEPPCSVSPRQITHNARE